MRTILLAVSFFLIPVGLVLALFTPIPGGTFLFSVGLMLLICTSDSARRFIQSLRVRLPRIDRGMAWLEHRMGPTIGGALGRTRPEGGGTGVTAEEPHT